MSEQVTGPLSPEMNHARIEIHRRLVSDAVSVRTGVTEYSDNNYGTRILTIPVLSEQSETHKLLTAKKIPVFPVMAMDDKNLLLQVPSDARTIHSTLKFMARDVAHYREIFTEIGQVLGRCVLSRVGVPIAQENRTMLGGIAFSVDSESVFGSNIHLLPPYEFETGLNKQDTLSMMDIELRRSESVTTPVAEEFVRAASVGWERVRT